MSALLTSLLEAVGGAAAVGNGLLFLTAGIGKLRNRGQLQGVIANYRLLPPAMIAPFAATLPVLELGVATGLLVGFHFSATVAIMLLCLFAWAMAVNLRRGRGHIDCGCGRSELRQPLSWTLVARNLVLALLLLPALHALPAIGTAAWTMSLAAGLVLFVLTLLANALAGLAGQAQVLERKTR